MVGAALQQEAVVELGIGVGSATPGPGPSPSPSPSPNLQQEDIVERGEGEELPPQVVARLSPAALRLYHEDVGRRAHLVRVSGQG